MDVFAPERKINYNLLSQNAICTIMLTLDQIESAILQLPSHEVQQLIEWLSDVDYQRWDKQLEEDINNGKLDDLAAEAIAEFEAGNCQDI